MMRSWARTPVGRPRSIPIEVTWRLRMPPPVAMTSLNFASAAPHDRTRTDLDDVAERQHAHHGRFGRGHDLLVEQALAHQHRFDVMTTVDGTFAGRELTEG